jgi:sterol desaturase/sphingolipid hydroxylase (fatty acid hydroxylase superfamily)
MQPSPIAYALPVFLLAIAVEAGVARWRGSRSYSLPDALTSLHFGYLSEVERTLARLLVIAVYAAVYRAFHAFELPTNAWWVWVGTVLAYDFCYYWVHRFGHEVNLIWASHQVHHSSEYFNLSTALRQTGTGSLLKWPFYLGLAVIGVPPTVFAGAAFIDLLYQVWVHTEQIGRLGWLDRVFVTPSNHRVHHGQNDYCIDRNYGGILILWDRLFGTYADERAAEPVVYGVRKPFHSYNPVWGNFVLYRELLVASRAQPTWRDALAVWFGPPQGWGAAVPHADFKDFQRFEKPIPRGVRRACLVQSALLTAASVYYVLMATRLPWSGRLLSGGVILLAASLIGLQLEGRMALHPRHWRLRAPDITPIPPGDTP